MDSLHGGCVILCEYQNRRKWQPRACFDQAVRFLQDVGERTGRTMAICAHHYGVMGDEALRAWKEISREEYEVSKVHES